MSAPTEPPFTGWDWAIVITTLGISMLIGLYFWWQRHSKSIKIQGDQSNRLLIGDGKMKPLSVSVSMLVTYFSAIAIIGKVQIFYVILALTTNLKKYAYQHRMRSLKKLQNLAKLFV